MMTMRMTTLEEEEEEEEEGEEEEEERDEEEEEGEEKKREKKRFHMRRGMLVWTALLLTMQVGFRCGTAFDVRPVGDSAWFLSKGAYYCFIFLLELVVVYSFVVLGVLGCEL